jgi:hypothetical protein
MKERPILFSTEMIRAILGGRKTQTRRVMKPQPAWYFGTMDTLDTMLFKGKIMQKKTLEKHAPYGIPGDLLYVRETWGLPSPELQKLNPVVDVVYKADVPEDNPFPVCDRWKPSIHMPKKFARIWLEVKDVRVERLQDISEEDIVREGAWNPAHSVDEVFSEAYEAWSELWDSINAKRGYGWDMNPFCWVIDFSVVGR